MFTRKEAIIAVSVLIIISSVGLVYRRLWGPGDRGTRHKIGSFVRKNQTVLTIAEHTSFQWSRFYIFPGYTSRTSMEEELGFPWLYKDGPPYDDSPTYLVFVDDQKVVAEWNHPFNLGDFRYAYRKGGFTPENAIFSSTLKSERIMGQRWYVLKPVEVENSRKEAS